MADVTVTVTFDPTGNPSVKTDIPSDGLRIPSGTSIITFTLNDLSSGQAQFSQPPVEFPPGPVPFTLIQPVGPSLFQLQDNNDAAGEERFSFVVVVLFNNTEVRGDPVIVNEPPVTVSTRPRR